MFTKVFEPGSPTSSPALSPNWRLVAGRKRLYTQVSSTPSTPGTPVSLPDSPTSQSDGECCICDMKVRANRIFLCDGRLGTCPNMTCRECAWTKDLPQKEFDLKNPKPHEKAFCPECNDCYKRRSTLRQNPTTTTQSTDTASHILLTNSYLQLVKLGMQKSFVDPETMIEVPVNKGDMEKGKECSNGMVNAFFYVTGKRFYKGVVMYTEAKARKKEIHLHKWKNCQAYIKAYLDEEEAKEEAKYATVPTPFASPKSEPTMWERIAAELEEEDNVVWANEVEKRLEAEAAQKAEEEEAKKFFDEVIVGDITESDSDHDVPKDNVLNGPFGGRAV